MKLLDLLLTPAPVERVRLSEPDDGDIDFKAALRPIGGPPPWASTRKDEDRGSGQPGPLTTPGGHHGSHSH